MTTRLVAALLAVALAGAAGCPDPTAAAPRPMAAGPHERTRVEGEQGARLDEYLSRTVPFGFSGAVFVTDRRGVLLHKGYGLADVAKGVPITTQTVFDMGSITKAFTAEAVVLLAAERRLSVQDTLGKYFPDAPADKRGLTLEQVLTHTAGLVDLTGDDYDVVTREQLLRDAFAAPLVATPGQAWSYSNAGYSVLAAIVEKVSGQTYEQFLRKRFFAPAGMNQTGYVLPKWDPALVAHTYTLGVDHGSPLERFRRNGGPYWVLLGNGGMLTTSADLYRWEQALRAGRVLSFPLQEDLFAPRFQRGENVSQGYAWTIERYPDGLAVHHGGDAPGLGVNAEHRRYREEALTIVVLANTRHKGASTRRSIVPGIRATLLGRDAPLPPAVTPLAPDALKAFEGTYDVAPGAFLTVRAERGGLVVGSSGQEAVDLFTFTRAEASLANRRVRNQKALELVEALRAPSAEPLQALLGGADPAARLRAALRRDEERFGRLQGADVVGTSRMDRGAFVTTLRLRFEREGAKLVRVGWQQNRPVIDSDDEALPSLGDVFAYAPISSAQEDRVWSTGYGAFTAYDLATDQALPLSFGRSADGAVREMVVHLPSGPVRAPRRN